MFGSIREVNQPWGVVPGGGLYLGSGCGPRSKDLFWLFDWFTCCFIDLLKIVIAISSCDILFLLPGFNDSLIFRFPSMFHFPPMFVPAIFRLLWCFVSPMFCDVLLTFLMMFQWCLDDLSFMFHSILFEVCYIAHKLLFRSSGIVSLHIFVVIRLCCCAVSTLKSLSFKSPALSYKKYLSY